MTTYLFPGQGSQTRGMGEKLFYEFSDYLQKANNILGFHLDTLCLQDPDNKLNKTEYTQPALYVVNALTYLKRIKDEGKKPNYVAGHSLGEYNALFASEVFDFETGLKLVQKRGSLMGQAEGGGMAAIVGLKENDVKSILEKNKITDVYIANYNSHTQIVISGSKEKVNATEMIFLNAGAIIFMPLKVSGAFHSPYMKDAQNEFTQFLKKFSFSPPKIPVIANVNAKPYQASEVDANLIKQIVSPVRWTQTIDYLLSQGETNFVEIGPGKVLAGLVTRIQKGQ
jgi:malonyl CoA-acyl carrier protein transacylase